MRSFTHVMYSFGDDYESTKLTRLRKKKWKYIREVFHVLTENRLDTKKNKFAIN